MVFIGIDAAQLGVILKERAVELAEAAAQQHIGVQLEDVLTGKGRVRLREGVAHGILAAGASNLIRK